MEDTVKNARRLPAAPKGFTREHWALTVENFMGEGPDPPDPNRKGLSRSARLQKMMRLDRKYRLRVERYHAALLDPDLVGYLTDTDEPETPETAPETPKSPQICDMEAPSSEALSIPMPEAVPAPRTVLRVRERIERPRQRKPDLL